MSQFDKLIAKIVGLSKNVRFDEVRKVMEYYGYKMHGKSRGSSHFTFRKQGARSVTIPKSNPVKKDYIIMVKSIVEEEMQDEKH